MPLHEDFAEIRLLDGKALQGSGLTAQEADIAAVAANVQTCRAFDPVAASHANGSSVEVVTSGATIIYEPGLPQNLSGMTLFAENGFVTGPGASSSGLETVKTVLHELYGLKTSLVGRTRTASAGPTITMKRLQLIRLRTRQQQF